MEWEDEGTASCNISVAGKLMRQVSKMTVQRGKAHGNPQSKKGSSHAVNIYG